MATSLVAFAKRGGLSDEFVMKIAEGVKLDLGKALNIVPAAVVTTYAWYKTRYTSEAAQTMYDHWMNVIPVHAIRLRATVQQMRRGGLTCLDTTTRALASFPTFRWDRLAALSPYGAELDAYSSAVVTVGGDDFYGYNQDLGLANASNYRNLASVCSILLIDIGGDRFLRRAQGFKVKPQNSDAVRELIYQYGRDQGGGGGGPVDPGLIAKVNKAFNRAGGILGNEIEELYFPPVVRQEAERPQPRAGAAPQPPPPPPVAGGQPRDHLFNELRDVVARRPHQQ